MNLNRMEQERMACEQKLHPLREKVSEITLKEQTRLQLRLDWQNPFKWFNWGGPSTTLNVQNATQTLTYGKINPGSNAETGTGTAGYGGTPLLNLVVALKW